jgi:hypothetical protein
MSAQTGDRSYGNFDDPDKRQRLPLIVSLGEKRM